MIQRRGYRGVVVRRPARVVAAGLLARAAASAGRAVINAAKNYKFKSGGTQSSLARKIGPRMAGPKKPIIRTPRSEKRVYQESGVAQAATGNELSKYSGKVGAYPKLNPLRLLKLMKAGMTDVVLRSQGITNFDTNVGFYPLANRRVTDSGLDVIIPMHVWDLTKFPNVDVGSAYAGFAYAWEDPTATANAKRVILTNQAPNGSAADGNYQIEKSGGDLQNGVAPHFTKAMHDWTQIKMNLYGARRRGTTYYIDFVRCKDEYANLVEAGVGNPDLKDLVRTLQSKLIYSNLQSHNMKNMSKLQIVKSYKFYVPGGSADDLDNIGKVKELNLFMRHGNVYNFAWTDGFSSAANDIPHLQEDGIDFTNNQQPHNHPWHSSRLYMIVRAFSPEQRLNTAAGWAAGGDVFRAPADPLTEPSYDLIIRNKWTLPS